jgi:hypothetical protein
MGCLIVPRRTELFDAHSKFVGGNVKTAPRREGTSQRSAQIGRGAKREEFKLKGLEDCLCFAPVTPFYIWSHHITYSHRNTTKTDNKDRRNMPIRRSYITFPRSMRSEINSSDTYRGISTGYRFIINTKIVYGPLLLRNRIPVQSEQQTW